MLAQIGRAVPLQRSHASFGDFVALMKPRVMSLVVFTALVGLLVAPGHLDPLIGFIALLCIAAGGRAAGGLQIWYEPRIDPLVGPPPPCPIPPRRGSRAPTLLFWGVLFSGGRLLFCVWG